MNRKTLIVLLTSLILVFGISMIAEARDSKYLAQYGSSAYAEGNSKILVDFFVQGTGTMSSIGVTQILIERKQGTSWVTDRTFKSQNYSNFLGSNKALHLSEVSFTGTAGVTYRATITAYAGDNTGSDSKTHTSNTVLCR